MLGTITNTVCIIVGTIAGTLLKKGLGEKYREVLYNAMGLASLVLGANAFVANMPHSEFPVLFILSLSLGGIVGTWLDLDGRVTRFIDSRSGEGFAQGLITACLLYCIGTFSIVGPILSALKGDNTFLYTNSTLDLVTSTVFATTYGIGMIVAAPILFCWQGMFYMIAKLGSTSALLQGTLVNELSIVGGVLIVASGLSILKLKNCKTLNLLPSLLVPVLWFLIKGLL
ncbi:MAG: DUF554 domain-containing protein [Bacteroidales bacterium]|nr:DUF554 domain-containing protein [Bacteroidales bacterium]